jgi:hypothetical protein
MIKWLVILTSLWLTELNAQTNTLVLKIDTLIFQMGQEEKIQLKVGNQGFLNMGENFDSTQVLSPTTYPNYTSKIELKNDSSILEIPIDKNGSHIKLKNVYNYDKDTLTINKLTIFVTKPADSTITVIYYTRKINGVLADRPYKIKVKKSGSYFIPPPSKLEMIIDGVVYKSILSLTSERHLVSHGHGYKPRKYMKKNGEDKKRITYIFVDKGTYKYYWIGEMKLIIE